MFAASKTDSVSSEIPDPQFNYVTMLLHGDGTNGAQNNTFLDSSASPLTITRNGNPTQGSFSPYGSNWSNYFNGTNATLNFPNSSNFAFGTGSFTIEFWINAPLEGDKFFLGGRSAIGSMHITSGGGGTGTTTGVLRYVATSTIVSSNVITDSTWHHCAIVRNGSSNITLYVDGISVGTGTDTNNYTTTSGTWYIARNDLGEANFLNGYLSNLRIVKGTAVYTSNFTPSTTPLTAISGTSLLTCADNRFIDDSATAVTITPTGSTSVQRFNPFGTSTAYSTSVIGGSAYFDGTGDSLVTPTTSTLNIGTGAFQIDFWMYSLAIPAQFVGPFGTNNAGIFFAVRSGNLDFVNNVDTVGVISAPYPKINQWHHIVLVRNSSNVRSYYIDGVRVGTLSNSADFNQTEITIGNTSWNGYLSNFRCIVGSNIADPNSSTVTIPTAPTTAVSNTQLLTNFTNGAIFDNAMMNDLETVGNAQISTSVVKYGTGSMYFDGTGDYLLARNNSGSTINGIENFTIEAWIYPTEATNFHAIYCTGYPIQMYIANNNISFYASSANEGGGYQVNNLQGPSNSISANTWVHVAVVRNGTTFTAYVNGVGGTPQTNSVSIAFPNNESMAIGTYPLSVLSYPWIGYIDDLRITKGYARYPANFTPPTKAFSNIGPY